MTIQPSPVPVAGTRFVCGLIGSGIGESLTPAMHEAEADRRGMPYVYRRTDLTALGLSPEEGVGLIRPAGLLGFSGLNITHPCKRLAVEHVDELSAEAATIGAINTVVFDGGRVVGHNTDVTGFAHGFARDMPEVALGQVVQVGAGGAGAAVAHALVSLGAGRLVVADLDPGRAAALATSVAGATGAEVVSAGLGDLPAQLSRADGVVNCTPVGMAQHPGTPFDPDLLDPRHWVVDVVYRPLVTELVRAARARGCRVATGAGMAIGQAVDSFALFTGVRADPDAVAADFARLVDTEGRQDAHA
ncbi:shikimate dehydrogenase [Ornithinimicrobium pekingense]|uniref:Shikimate dehydrogenase (NADP(+)) n=1 Tax=Ornithinimicrobium pekingense TaxID=384677 RepID=A0ABQ2F7Y2_9MICO|nr:shikimate dehydrogenase [Ornithinimicrobium pekingense]GGK60148.1 shikimate dehydrogenase (NADP(+)) [Ornithinimicrobium pekingense]